MIIRRSVKVREKGAGVMNDHVLNRRRAGIVGMICLYLITAGVTGQKEEGLSLSQRISQCQKRLKGLSSRLGEYAKARSDQPYYKNLYQQTQDFLETIDDVPHSALQMERCRNLLQTIQQIAGTRVAKDFAPLGDCSPQTQGQLTSPILESTASRRKQVRSVRFIHQEEKSQHKKKDECEKDEWGEELELFSEPALKPITHASKKSNLASEDADELKNK